MSVITADASLTPRLRDVLAAYRRARHEIRMQLGAQSAGAVVDGVHRGAWPRRGDLPGGLRYFVNGIGYTVVMPGGGQVHLDAGDGGDCLSVTDVTMFLRTAGDADPAPGAVDKGLRRLAAEGGLDRTVTGRYRLP